MSGVRRLFREAARRKVFRTAALYAVAAWVVLQAADLAFPGLGIAEEAIRYVWIGAFAGLPLVLLFAWRYQVTRGGVVRTAPDSDVAPETLPLGRADYLILGTMLLAASAVAVPLVLEIREHRAPEGLTPTVGAEEIPRNSVAVLPLENVTGDPEQEYFAAGMHDALITALSRVSALKVISRGSANVYRNVVRPPREIALDLGVAHLVEGSVFRTEDRVRINLRLTDAGTGESLWSESYERDLRDVLALQGEVAREVVREIQVSLTPEEEARLASAREVDPEIYETYLKGMFHLKQYTPEGTRRGLEYLREAVDRDPDNPRALAGLALGYNTVGHGIGRDAFPKAMDAARRALELDEYSGEAWAALSEAQLYYEWDWEASERSARRAIQLSPNLDIAHAHFAYLLSLLGRWEEAFAEAERARELSPLDATWAAFAAWLYGLRERWDEAYTAVREARELDPDMPLGTYVLSQLLTAQGRVEEGVEAAEALPPESPIARWALGPAYAMAGREADARRVAKRMVEDPGPKDLLHAAFTYAALGDEAEAIRWLESAREARVDWFPWIAIPGAYGGSLEGLRDDPRFREIVEGLGLPDHGGG